MKNEKGITLAILIITIIVMLILASATIVTLGDGNLIGRTDESAYQYELSNFRAILEEYHSMRQLKAREKDYNPKDLYATYNTDFGNNGVKGGIKDNDDEGGIKDNDDEGGIKDNDDEGDTVKQEESIYTILKGLEGSRLDGKIYIVEGEIVEEWEYNNLKIIAKVNDEVKDEVNVTITADLDGGYKLQYKVGDGTWQHVEETQVEKTFEREEIKNAGTDGITIYAQTVKNEEIGSSKELTLTIPSAPTDIAIKSNSDSMIATATGAQDEKNGIKGYKYSISTDGGTTWSDWSNVTSNGYKFDETPSTNVRIRAVAVNTLGLESDPYEVPLLNEDIDGVIEITQSPEEWTNTNVNVTLKLQYSGTNLPDNYTLQYKIGTSEWKNIAPATIGTSGTITVSENNTTVSARLYNKNLNHQALNVEHTVTNIDKVLPTIELSASDESYNSFKLSAKVNDSDSGLSKIIWYYKLEGESNYTSIETEYTPMNSKEKGEIGVTTKTQDITDLVYGGTYQVYAEVYDVAGNKSTSKDSTQEDIKITTPSYTITYDANGGEGAPEQQSKAHGVDLVLSNTVPTRTGYEFQGWATTNTSTTSEYPAGGTYKANGNATLYAVWSISQYPINLNIYVDGINYEGDEGYSGRILANLSVGESQYGYVADHYEEYNYGETWNIDGILIDDQVVPYTATGTVGTEENNIDIYFNTVTFVSSNTTYGSVTESEMIALNGTAYTISDKIFNFADGRTVTAIANTVIGYWTEFTGWSVSDGTITEKTEVTANFTGTAKTVTVTFDSNDGSGRTDTQVFTYGVSGQSFSEKGWTREGYTLNNWNFESDGSGNSHSLIASVANSWIEANAPEVTLYAVWTAKPIQIYYNTNGGAVANTDGSRFTTQDSDGWVLDNNNSNVFYNRVTPDTQIDLPNYNNKGFIYIEKTGYTAVSGAEWKTYDGSTTFNHIGDIDYNTLKAVATDEGTYYRLDLYVNWSVNTVTLYYYPNADDITRNTTNCKESEYISEGEYAGAYKMQTINYTDTDAANKNIWNCTSLFTRTGYHIENDETAWIKDSPDSGEYITQASTDFKSLMENGSVVIKLYANWQENILTLYYYPNANDVTRNTTNCKESEYISTGDYAGAYKTQIIKYTEAVDKNIWNCTSLFTREGYYIENDETAWIKDSPSSGEYVDQQKYDFSSLIANNTGVAMKLYANWNAKSVQIYYNVNGGIINTNNTRFTTQDSEGWILDNNNNGNAFYNEVKFNGKVDLPNYNNNGFINIKLVGYTAVSGAEWKTYDGSTTFNHNGDIDFNTLKAASTDEGTYYRLELYVNWAPNELTIYYYPNATNVTRDITNCTESEYISTGDYAGAYKTQVIKYTEAVNKNIWNCTSLFTRTGYYIENDETAWIKDSPDSGEYVDQQSYDFSTLIANQTGVAIKLYANWQPKKVTVTFMRNHSAGDTLSATQTFTYDATGQSFSNKGWSKTGYTLKGWAFEQDATTINHGINANVSNSWINNNSPAVTLYAVWQANTYNLTIDPNGAQIRKPGESSTTTSPFETTFTYGTKQLIAETVYQSSNSSAKWVSFPRWTNGDNVRNLVDGCYVPYKAGYTFEGWKVIPTGGTVATKTWYDSSYNAYMYDYEFNSDYAGDVTIQAQWVKDAYTIKYVANTGNSTTDKAVDNMPSTQIKSTDVNLTLSSLIPAWTGRTFLGWSTSSTATTPEYLPGGTYTANKSVTLYAVWKTNTYTVNYYNGTTKLGSSSHTYGTAKNLTTISSLNGTQSGYTFAGWATSTTATSRNYTNGQSVTNLTTTAGGTVNLYAVWQRNATFQSGPGGNAQTTAVQYYNPAGPKYSVTAPTPVANSGWTTLGWRDDTTAGAKEISAGAVSTSSASTFYAVYSRNATFYSSNNGSNVQTATQYYNAVGGKYSVKAPAPATISGWTALGWRDDTTAAEAEYSSNATITVSNGTYYAVYSRNATFYSGIAKATKNTVKQYYNSTSSKGVYSVKAPTPVAISGWTTLGWRTNTTATTQSYTSGATITASNSTYYAVYSRTVSLAYNANGGSGTAIANSTATQYYNTNGAITTPSFTLASNTYTKTGYTFSAWAAGSTSGTKYTAGETYTGFTPAVGTTSTTQTMYASWKANTYTVKYNGNGSTSGSTASSTHTYGVAKALTANGFKRAYTVTYNYNYTGSTNGSATATYNFAGWNKKADGSSTSYTNKQSVTNLANSGSITLYAQWTGGNVTLPTPTRTGYTFGGWYKEAACTNKIGNGGATYTPTANTTLYAKWTAKTVKVTFMRNQSSTDTTSTTQTFTYDVANQSFNKTTWTKTGHTFLGWSKTQSATTATYTDGNSVVNNWINTNSPSITLYAVWTANKYTITLNNQSATTAGSTAVYEKYGTGIYKESTCTNKMTTTANPITVPKKTGYTFGGYYTGTNGSGTLMIYANGYITSNFTNTKYSANTTLYAKWTVNTYKITLNNQSATTAGSTAIYEKYSTGIYKESTCTTAMTTSANPITVPKKTGYTFGGYYTGTNGSGTQMINASGNITSSFTNTKYSAAATLYAKWTANTYKITLSNQGATTAGSTAVYEKYGTGIYKESACTNKMTTTANPITVPKKTGYTFGGYYTGTNGTGTQMINAKGYITSSFTNTKYSSVATLYAKWTANKYTLTIDANGGKVQLPGNATVADSFKTTFTYGDNHLFAQSKYYSLDENAIRCGLANIDINDYYEPYRYGYRFTGWKITQGSGSITTEKVEDSDNTSYYKYYYNCSFVGNVTIQAQWELLPTVTINANGGSLSYWEGEGTENWKEDQQTSTKPFYPGCSQYVVAAAHARSGAWGFPWIWSYTDSAGLQIPYREGYTFTGWKVTKNKNGEVLNIEINYHLVPSSNGVYQRWWSYDGSYNEDITITAQWTKNP